MAYTENHAINQPRNPSGNGNETLFSSKYDPKIADKIIAYMKCTGATPKEALNAIGNPICVATWYNWVDSISGLLDRARQARAAQGRHWFDNGAEKIFEEWQNYIVTNEDDYNKQRGMNRLYEAKIRALEWHIERANPREFGRQVNVDQTITMQADQWQRICEQAQGYLEDESKAIEAEYTIGESTPCKDNDIDSSGREQSQKCDSGQE